MDDIVAARVATLTNRQRRLLRLAAGGVTVAEIALRLDLPVPVVEQELASLRAALGVRTTGDAALLWWASRLGAAAALAAAAQELLADQIEP
jgi:DNA-binding CsgD family transcriptional regulator